ncbi:MAG: 16S rRNA (guanine(966)-N(2))-methyltransferase RsmD [Lachnospiraceae bacterium]|nr:16S rRNA (guanine(966)-N(2))-methyltransferase RsmD [Lachnospiraceae bacterium]
MRVIAGTARRLQLKTIEGKDTRPTTDRIKETLFNILQPELLDCTFLDLFSGSGGIGIEALSRGARRAYFVEQNSKAMECIKDNLKFTRLMDKAELLMTDALSALRRLEGQKAMDMIFMDPPYGQELEQQVLRYLKDSSLADQDTLIIIESSLETSFSFLEQENLPFEVVRYKKYKTNMHVFVERKEG